MADLFAPKLQSEVAYERPVETPSALGALANLGGFFVDQYSREQRSSGGSAGSTKVDPNLAVFAQGLEKVEAIRDQRGEPAALMAERQLAKNFAIAGVEFGSDYEDVYKTTTGRQWAGYGRDVESFMLDEALKDSDVQASYIASFVALPQNATDADRIDYAIGQKATITAAANVIARSQAEANYTWTVQTEAAYAEGIDSFVNVGMGALVQGTQDGGRVGPQAIANMQAQWAQQKVAISRPPNITDDQWKSTQAKINSVDNMFEMLDKAASSDVLFEEITTALSDALLAEGGGSTASILAAATAIKDPTSLSNLMGSDVKTFIMDVSQSINLDVTQPELFSNLLEQPSVEGGGVALIENLPSKIQEKVAGLSPQQYYDGLKASGKLANLTDPNSLQRPDGQAQFVENAAAMGAVMMSMENDQFLSPDFLKKLVGNPNFLRNVNALDGVNPEGASVVRSYVVSGLNTELARQQRNVAALEEGLGAVWDGNKYILTRESIMAKDPSKSVEQADNFLAWVGKTYGGNTQNLADGMVPLPEGMGFNPQGLSAAYDRRNAINVIRNSLNELNPITTDEARIARGEIVTTTLPPAEVAQNTGPGTEEDPIVFTEQTGMTYEMYQAIPAGAYYVDPTGLKSQKRRDSRVTNEDIGDGDPLGSGTMVRDFSTPGSKEEYDALPSGARWIDPDGNRRTKP